MATGIDPLLYGGGQSRDNGRVNDITRRGEAYTKEYNEKLEKSESFESALFGSVRSKARDSLNEQENYSISSDLLSPDLTRGDVLNHVGENPQRQKLFDAAMEFESFFLEKMFKEMKKNIPKGGLTDGGFAEEIFEDLLTTERVRNISKQSEFGLAEKMYQQLSML